MWGNGDTSAAKRRYCYTVGVVTTITGGPHTTQASYATAQGNVDIVASGSGASARLKCTDNKVTAEANNTFATEIIKNSNVKLFMVNEQYELSKLIKSTIYGKKIVVGMGAGTISAWMRELPSLI